MRLRILLATLMLTTSSWTNAAEQVEVEITGHRGASYDAPENTLSSVRLGWEQNADSVEIDVWLSKDGHIILSHDKDTKKCAGVDRLVVDQTLAELHSSTSESGSMRSTPGNGCRSLAKFCQPSRPVSGC